jgi:ketosteroid isomerase-like protein
LLGGQTGARYPIYATFRFGFRLENGKIREVREYCDSVLTEKALGAFPEAEERAAG